MTEVYGLGSSSHTVLVREECSWLSVTGVATTGSERRIANFRSLQPDPLIQRAVLQNLSAATLESTVGGVALSFLYRAAYAGRG